MQANDYPVREQFFQWFLRQCALQPDFPTFTLFTKEVTFRKECVFNMNDTHEWASENPHAARPHAFLERLSGNVWAGIEHDFLIGPYILPTQVKGSSYFIFV